MKFEMVEKRKTRIVVTTSDDIWSLLHEMATTLSPVPGQVMPPRFSGARGEIEIGIEGGAQVTLRVLD